jgi:hypothetical protein
MSKGTTKEITICGQDIKLGDFMKVRYSSGRRMKGALIEGTVTELWDKGHVQARLSCGWCFHDNDEIIEHIPFLGEVS